ncbi:MAG: ATP-binding protein [Candidatus Poribacteria bacterium]|nr:ATP-binding protein [Candidatus Poribacteria bacterium]
MMREDHARLKITLIVLLILIFNFLHYAISTPMTKLHHIIFRLNYLPIVMAAFWFGWRGGIGAALLTTFILLPDLVIFHRQALFDLNSYLEVILYNVMGVVIGMLSSAEMRQRHKYNETVAQLAKAEHLAQLGQMVASLAHEIRNPLQSLQPTASLLESDLPTKSQRKELTGIVREEVERLNTLVTDFLQFANPKPPLWVETDLNHLVEKTVEMVQLQLSPTSVPIRTALTKDLPPCRVDPEQIQQVLLNLLENAIEAVGDEGRIEITTAVSQNAVFVDVIDDGRGIETADLPHIFEPFFSQAAGGTGLGLSICQKIIEAHRGKIWCYPNKETGCRFTFRLPIGN